MENSKGRENGRNLPGLFARKEGWPEIQAGPPLRAVPNDGNYFPPHRPGICLKRLDTWDNVYYEF